MTEPQSLKEFHRIHHWPDQAGVESLFRFSKIDTNNLHFLSHLFVDAKLYHALPSQFNDPFECKPHFNWPKSADKVRAIRSHLIKVARSNGFKRKDAEKLASDSMIKTKFIQETIYEAIQKSFGELRICSFTTSKENLLFWSHYAAIHTGFCVEFDASKMPIAYAYKVAYSDEYPDVEYPRPSDATAFIPALIKSKDWEYEDEYRTIFVPEATKQPKNDGESLLLHGDEITNVYFGAAMEEENKEKIKKLVESGPFSPVFWNASLSKSSFALEFTKCN